MTYLEGWLLQLIPLTLIILITDALNKNKSRSFLIGCLVGVAFMIGTLVTK
jgi:hypothetical protein